MPYLKVDQEKVQDAKHLQALCPFEAIQIINGKIEISEACRLCRICVQDPSGAITWKEEAANQSEIASWEGIAVLAEFSSGDLHPVTLELLGKARELADRSGQRVFVVAVGAEFAKGIDELRHYGANEIVVYEDESLRYFRGEPYTAVLEDFVQAYYPSILLIGATAVGRSLAPRVAARLRTGLTADCTVLDIAANGDLVQIRPAFGGNIMAQIKTPQHRPQLATVRYKVLPTPERKTQPAGMVTQRQLEVSSLASTLQVISVSPKPKVKDLTEAEVIVVAGRGLKQAKDLELLQQLADSLGGMLAATRPLIEAGWAEPHLQIGLSGRTVKPRLLIAVGVSGAVQFTAGMGGAECIVAINSDPEAPIFKVAHIGLVGDLYEIIPYVNEQMTNDK